MSKWEIARDYPPEALCAHCTKPKSDHGLMAFSCPPPFKKTFVPLPGSSVGEEVPSNVTTSNER